MRAVDPNVIVRLLARDDPKQALAAEEFIANGAWVSMLALAEAAWILTSVYELTPGALARAISMLLDHRNLALQDADAVAAALALFESRSSLRFSDCLMLEVAGAQRL
jgi:predicted nucleic-acid-binding protein